MFLFSRMPSFDSPVLHYVEAEKQPKIITESFAEFIQVELRSMETNYRRSLQLGGSFMYTVLS